MKENTQAKTNPFPYSDSNKRYHTFDYYLKHRFGEKCARIALDAGFTCPNIDGTCGVGGCIYCYDGSASAQTGASLVKQYEAGRMAVAKKWKVSKFIPYLQAHTNTYAPVDTLRRIYQEAASLDGAVMLAIATRADCLSPEVIELLRETAEHIPLLVELGLQSTNDQTAQRIGRGHDYETFCSGYHRLRSAGGDIAICIHLINGLPGENAADMISSAKAVAALSPDMVKLHLLHVIRDTPLHRMYLAGEYTPMDEDTYIQIVCDQLECFPPEVVIGRITGDAPDELLVTPLWCRKKTIISNNVDRCLFKRQSMQGKNT